MGHGMKHDSHAEYISLLRKKLKSRGIEWTLKQLDAAELHEHYGDPDDAVTAIETSMADVVYEGAEGHPDVMDGRKVPKRKRDWTAEQLRSLRQSFTAMLEYEPTSEYKQHNAEVAQRDERQAEQQPPDRHHPDNEGGIGAQAETSKHLASIKPSVPFEDNGRRITVLCCGDRNWTDRDLLFRAMARLADRFNVARVIHGAGRGADALVDVWVRSYNALTSNRTIQLDTFPADWDAHGKAAGPIRNRAMLSQRPDLVIAFHKDLAASKGTAWVVRAAANIGIPYYVVPSPPKPAQPELPYRPHEVAKRGRHFKPQHAMPTTDKHASDNHAYPTAQ